MVLVVAVPDVLHGKMEPLETNHVHVYPGNPPLVVVVNDTVWPRSMLGGETVGVVVTSSGDTTRAVVAV
jgi:hypothetical protein